MAEDQTRAIVDLLYRVSRDVATALELRTVLQRLIFASLETVGGERGTIIVMDDEGAPVESTIVFGTQVHIQTTLQLRETIERGLAGWVVRHRSPALVPDTSQDERWLRRPDDAADQSGAKSAICVPLLAREKLVGVLTLVHPAPGTYTEDDLALMQAIADQAGIAVLNARLYAESLRQTKVMTALAEGAAAINASLRLEDVLQQILNKTIEALHVETAALALLTSTSGDLVFRAAAGKRAISIPGKRIQSGYGVPGWVAREKKGIVIADTASDPRFDPAVDQFKGIEIRSIACAPIFLRGKVIGVLEAFNPAGNLFVPDTIMVMDGICNLAGSAIQNAQLFERLQAAHQRYRELFQDSIDPILITDEDGTILEVNRRAEELSGYPAASLRGQKIGWLHDINWEKTGQNFEHLDNDQPCTYESSMQTRSNVPVPIDVYARKVDFDQGQSLQWILRDVRERKELDNLRDDMTAMIYHDLRSPLANIVSSLDIISSLVSNYSDHTIQSVLDIAMHSTGRIQRLLSSLLDINRLEAGNPVGLRRAVVVHALVQESTGAIKLSADNRQQTITADLPEEAPDIWVDEDMVRRVLINLLENAIKYTPPGGEIRIGARQEGDDWVRFWVQDNGPGIPAEARKRVFEKYVRLNGMETPGGLGVGLAFCRLAVEGHGGRIWVESEPGRGSRFLLTLPSAKTD